MRAAQKVLGIDVGATTVKFAALNGERLEHRGVQKIASAGNAAFIAQLAAIIAAPEFQDCARVGIGSPGPLDIERGVVIASANMPAVRDCELIPELKKLFPQKDIRLDNDANAATLGEKFFGAGRGHENFAVFTLGTGVGGGCVYENRLYRGFKGNFFEVGHIPVLAAAPEPRLCGCGNRGCLEAYASATGVSASYKALTGDILTAADIAARAHAGDGAAQSAYSGAGEALGLAAATITQLMNITEFILTGGMAAAAAWLRPALEKSYQAHTFALFHPLAKFTFTEGDENAGIFGAAALFL